MLNGNLGEASEALKQPNFDPSNAANGAVMGLVGPRASKVMTVYVLGGLCASPSRLFLLSAGKFDCSWDDGTAGGAPGLCEGNLLWMDSTRRSSWEFLMLRVVGAIIPALMHRIL